MRRVAQDEKRDYAEVFERRQFQEQLRQKYLELPRQLIDEPIQVIGANRPVETVFQDVITAITPLLERVA